MVRGGCSSTCQLNAHGWWIELMPLVCLQSAGLQCAGVTDSSASKPAAAPHADATPAADVAAVAVPPVQARSYCLWAVPLGSTGAG